MWLTTRYGFFSFSTLPDGSIAVRSRLRRDLENLQEWLPSLEVHCIAGKGEYGWEALLEIDDASALFAHLLHSGADGDHLGQLVGAIPGQEEKSSPYQSLDSELLKLQLADLGERLVPGAAQKKRLEKTIRKKIKGIAKQSCLVGVDDEVWDVTRISWTGEEWEGFHPIPGYCYVEAFEHANPPHDFIYVVGVRTGQPEFVASYEGDIECFELTVSRLEASHLGLPETVPRP